MAKTSPAQFFGQVRDEARKVVWPSRKETLMTGLLAIFFFGTDAFFSATVLFLLSFLG